VGLGKDIWQLHSSQYKNLAQVPKGDVLVVGGGNSGAQLAVELSKSHNVTIATSGEPWFLPASIFGISLYWYIHLTGILSAKKNARVSRYVRSRGDGIVGQELQKLVKQGVIQLIPSKLSGCKDDMAYFENGEQLNVKNILWTTGFKPNYEWIGIKGVTNDAGQPIHGQGISPISGLYWLGLPWQTRLNSAIINGVKKDAKFIADSILSKLL
jgi:putative flavoprotein involved in K+ transport